MKKLLCSLLFLSSTMMPAMAASDTTSNVKLDEADRAHHSVTPNEQPAANPGDDLMFKAMSDELERSIHKLQLKGHPLPYFISYLITESNTCKISGSFGAITDLDEDHNRDLKADVRVGNYKLDSSGSSAGRGGFDIGRLFRGQAHALTTDNDYNALRRELWLETDTAYKRAIEGLEANESYLKQNNVEDRPDSMSKEKPVTHLEPTVHLAFDSKAWTANIRDLSGIFKNYPIIRSSKATISASAQNRWYLNNEGFRYRIGETAFALFITAHAQCHDGMQVSDDAIIPAYTVAELPSITDLEKQTTALAEGLTKLAEAPTVDDYRGPILFEGQAAAEFFHQLLEPRLSVTSGALQSLMRGELRDKLGERLLPKFINVVDDPKAKEFNGQTLFGTYEVDDDGVEGQKITLVDKGILKTLCTSRVPTRTVKQSNGHSHNGIGGTTNLFINSSNKLSSEALKAKLIELGKEDGLSEVYIARKLMTTPYDFDYSSLRSLIRSIGSGGAMLFPPILLYKVSTADGHEELTRGGSFSNVSTRVLREIESTGDDAKAYPTTTGQAINSIIAPSILVKEIEIQKPERTNSKGPVLKNPFFDKTGK